MQKLITEGIKYLPDNLVVLGKLVDKVLDYTVAYGEQLTGGVETARIASVRSGRNASPLHAPTVVLSFEGGRTLEIGVVKSIITPNFMEVNNTIRDEVVLAIAQQLP